MDPSLIHFFASRNSAHEACPYSVELPHHSSKFHSAWDAPPSSPSGSLSDSLNGRPLHRLQSWDEGRPATTHGGSDSAAVPEKAGHSDLPGQRRTHLLGWGRRVRRIAPSHPGFLDSGAPADHRFPGSTSCWRSRSGLPLLWREKMMVGAYSSNALLSLRRSSPFVSVRLNGVFVDFNLFARVKL